MKQLFVPILALTLLTMLAALPVAAGEKEKVMIALAGDDFEVSEMDISSLAVGESKTIETESGRVIDILRTVDGAEVYIDGEFLDIDAGHDGQHEVHKVTRHVEVVCEDEANCEKNVFVIKGDDADLDDLLSGEDGDVIIHKEIHLVCKDGGEGSCSDHSTWVSKDGDVDIEVMQPSVDGEKAHRVIVIKKEVDSED